MKRPTVQALLMGLMLLAFAGPALAQSADRFPRPEFTTGYQEPSMKGQPGPRSYLLEWMDVVVLVLALSAATYYSLKRVSRKAIFVLSVGSVLYFGFYREGCVCPIGSIQNVVLGLAGTGYILPLGVIFLFLMPLLFALFVGRVFCASVCPLGAAQEMVIIKPIKVNKGVKHFLSLVPYLYLGTGVLFAYIGADFIICKYDPFIGFYRMGANFGMYLFSGAVLIVGTVVARPYCRFMCPYSILLKWCSVLSKWHLKTTPTECIQCRLCEDSCPFDHLNKPTVEKEPEPRNVGIRRIALLLAATPVIIGAGIGLGLLAAPVLARGHFTVSLAERVFLEKHKLVEGTTEESRAFYETSTTYESLMAQADRLKRKVRNGAGILGAFMGLVVSCKLLALSIRRKRTDYEPNRGDCYSCARCSDACSVGRVPGVPVGTMRTSPVVLKFQSQIAQVGGGEQSG
ncbi:MAG TPA: 4Fe-4S binding protein [Planctomycetota bacterium]|nr:4Fe-4S binding protein [Planctomycetota bacterium]